MKKCKLDLLILLASKGAVCEEIPVSTSALSAELGGTAQGASQQTVSRWLLELENDGFVERKARLVRIAPKGRQKISQIAAIAKDSVSAKGAKLSATTREIKGNVVSGFREGKYYIALPEYKNQLMKLLGFSPFAGTLNVKLSRQSDVEAIRKLKTSEGLQTNEFTRDGRSFGRSKCFRIVVNGKVPGALIFPARSHYGDDVIEVIAPIGLREKLRLKDGMEVSIRICA